MKHLDDFDKLLACSKANPSAHPWPYIGTRAERAALFRTELLAAALKYAGTGYPVFPVSGDKRPLVKWKDGASTDAEIVNAWWARWPLAMIGMPTGARSGVVVLDVDRKGGVDGLASLRRVGIDPFRLTPIVSVTPSGGLHFFFRASSEDQLRNSAGLLAPGVDIRGEGGYIVLPPSLPSLDRDEYQWEGGGYGSL